MLHTIAIGIDNDAYRQTAAAISRLLQQKQIEVKDWSDSGEAGGAALRVAYGVANREVDGGIVLDAYGIGASITLNKVGGVRASHCTSSTTAMYTRCHNDSNLLCIGCELLGEGKILDIVNAWLANTFEGGRHAISVGMIREGEGEQFADKAQPLALGALVPSPCVYPFQRLFVGCDHAGYEAKKQVLELLANRDVQATDIGTDSTDIVRYPYYAARCDHAVLEGRCDGAILLCGTGIGMSIAANKFKGIRAALCNDVTTAVAARQTLDANVLCIGGKIIGAFELAEIVAAFLDTPYPGGSKAAALIAAVEAAGMKDTPWQPERNV